MVIVSALRGITAKLITGGFALRTIATVMTLRFGCIHLALAAGSITMCIVPTAGFLPLSERHFRRQSVLCALGWHRQLLQRRCGRFLRPLIY